MRRRVRTLFLRHQRELELTQALDLGERVEAADELPAQIIERHRVLLRFKLQAAELALVLRLLEIDEVEVDLVALENRNRPSRPRAALLAEDLRLDVAVAEAFRRLRRSRFFLRRRRRSCNRFALRLGGCRLRSDFRLRLVALAEQLRDALAPTDV